VRVAIKTLYYAALDPDVPVRDSFERARKDVLLNSSS
jgi:hypothetical protein